MDFTLNDEQNAIADLAAQILGDTCAPEHLIAHEAAGDPVLAKAWQALAQAELVGVALPEAVGGGGYGVLEAALIAEQVGRHVAPVPFAPTLAAALVLAEAGGHDDLLREVVTGDAPLAIAVDEAGGEVRAKGGTLTGERSFVPFAATAKAILVTATDEDGAVGLHLVRPGDGLTLLVEDAIWNQPQSTLQLDAAPAVPVGDAELAARAVDIATALAVAQVAGLCEGAMRITATYVSEREQFGSRIGTFQAVGQRMADSYIDTQGVHLTARQAAWRLAEHLPAAEALHVAKFWAAEGGHRVAHAAQHLHGGIGMDTSYPVHRYFRWIKTLEFQLGSGTDHLRSLGALLAAEPA